MSAAPVITIFVRHSEDCKYKGDEFEKRCRCRKHLRWTQNGEQHRRKANTRSWAEAEQTKRELEDQLAGRASQKTESNANAVQESIEIFLKDKKVQGVTEKVLGKYTRELERLRAFCDRKSVYVVQGVTRELLTEFCSTWEETYPSSCTRAKVRERLRSFLRYCYEAQWLPRIPAVPKIIIDEPGTQPLTAEEYTRLLDAVYVVAQDPKTCARVRAFFQLMRWSGLAIRDALTLEKSELIHDAKGFYRIVKQRAKMKRKGTGHVSVPIPKTVAEELLTVLNGNPRYFFWSGNGEAESITKGWAKYWIVPCFAEAKIVCGGHMMSHRLRDTFAVDLLEKGVPLEEVSKLLGHTSIKTTEKHYAKWVKGRQDRLDTLVTGTWETPKKSRKKEVVKCPAPERTETEVTIQ